MKRIPLVLLVLLLFVSAFSDPAKPRLFVGDKFKAGVKVDPMNPLPALIQTKTIKASTREFNLYCLAYIKDLPKMNFKWQIWDAKGAAIDEFTVQPKPGVPYAYAPFKVAAAGTYTVAFLNQADTSKPIATIQIVATDSGERKLGGANMSGSVGVGEAVLTLCQSVDDNWKPVGGSTSWKSGVTFNALVVCPKPMNSDLIGFVIYKQGEGGKDVEFVNEFEQNLQPSTSRKYATTEGLTSLPAGKYSVYVIDWHMRETNARNGNYQQYYAKTTITVHD